MPAQSTSRHLADLRRDGFVVIKSILSPEELSALREVSLKVQQRARAGLWPHCRTVGKQFPPWEWNPEKGIWGVQHIMHPSMPGNSLYVDLYFSDAILSIVRELLGCDNESLTMEVMNMLIRPDNQFELRWHRDDIPADAKPEEEMYRLNQPAFHAQYNLALFEDESLIVVPGSHKRPRTGVERESNPFTKNMPDQLVVKLGPGDIVFYNNNILHRGVYDSTKDRVTLHGSVGHVDGSKLRARNVMQHGVGKWVGNIDFSKLSEEKRKLAEEMRERLVEMGTENANTGYSLLD
jgi:nicotinamide N-methyltransferase